MVAIGVSFDKILITNNSFTCGGAHVSSRCIMLQYHGSGKLGKIKMKYWIFMDTKKLSPEESFEEVHQSENKVHQRK